jgi:pyrroloquinoline quinone (PQQ) biosynthesis protein C
MSRFFAELVASTDEDRRSFETHPVVMAAVAEGMSVERYRALLLELYHVVWYFNPVTAAAASRMGLPQDGGLSGVRDFLYEHMFEERGHDQWVLNDLQAIGVTAQQAREHEPQVHTLALVGYNFWATEHRNPTAALGMLYALEVIASVYGGPFASAISERLLLEGKSGVSFIDSHSSLDSQHIAALRDVLNQVHEPAAQAAVVQAVRVNFHHFTRIIEAI